MGDDRLSPMLLIDFEAGVDSIQSKCDSYESVKELLGHDPSVDRIDVLRIKEWSDFEGIIEFLQANPGRYKSVALDSLSEMNYLNLNGITGEAAAKSPRHDEDVPEMQDYLRSSFQMRKLVRQFRNLNSNSFWTAGVAEITNPLTKLSEVVPALTGKLTREVPGLVLIVGYLAIMDDEDSKPHRSLLVQPTGRYTAKDRSEGGKLGEYVIDPTLPGVFDKLGIPHPTEEE